jgi:hypothetical protein
MEESEDARLEREARVAEMIARARRYAAAAAREATKKPVRPIDERPPET